MKKDSVNISGHRLNWKNVRDVFGIWTSAEAGKIRVGPFGQVIKKIKGYEAEEIKWFTIKIKSEYGLK